MANLIPKIAKMLGVELGEEFKIKGYDGLIYKLTDAGLELTTVDGQKTKWFDHGALNSLLKGKLEIVKLPWKPKEGEKYWGFWYSSLNDAWIVLLYTWGNNPADFVFYKAGWVYRTKEEAQAALPKVAAELGVEYKL
jgi:hypothetical protein